MIIDGDNLDSRHVLKDIDPYVCLFEACDKPGDCFSTIEEWLRHMQYQHTLVWPCPLKGHDNILLKSKHEFQEHIEKEHGDIASPDQLPFLAEKGARPAVDTFETLAHRRRSIGIRSDNTSLCPLCVFDNVKVGDTSQADSSSSIPERSSFKRTLDHISGHLESIALLSLPERDDLESDVSTNRRLQQHEEAALRDEEDLPLPVFDDDQVMNAEENPTADDSLVTNHGMIELMKYFAEGKLEEEDKTIHRFSYNFHLLQLEKIRSLISQGLGITRFIHQFYSAHKDHLESSQSNIDQSQDLSNSLDNITEFLATDSIEPDNRRLSELTPVRIDGWENTIRPLWENFQMIDDASDLKRETGLIKTALPEISAIISDIRNALQLNGGQLDSTGKQASKNLGSEMS